MLFPLFAALLAAAIPALLIALGLSMAAQSHKDREKLSPFECGFDPKNSARIPFSLRFFLLAVIFLVFDIEIILLIPIPLMNMEPAMSPGLLGISFFLIILLLGLLHEWAEGSLDWMD